MATRLQQAPAAPETESAAVPSRKTNAQLKPLARHFTAEFDAIARAFARAQAERDVLTPLDLALQRQPRDLGRAEAALRFARDEGFLRRFLNAAIQEGLAGDAASRSGQALIAGARKLYPDDLGFYDTLIKSVAALAPPAGGPVYDVGMMQNKFVQVPRFICRIEDAAGSPIGSGVLVAPHLVATAAHVLLDPATGVLRTPIAGMQVRFDVIRQRNASEPRAIAVTGMAWSDLAAAAPLVPDANGVFGMALLPDPIDDDDIAILTLAEAPGHFRGWIDVSVAGPPAAWPTSVICFSLPLGGYQQFSTGTATRMLSRRVEHNCAARGGSSGGALIDNRARLVGVHHGQIPALNPDAYLGGGGTALAKWWHDNPQLRDPPPDPTALWEIRKSLPSGEGQPVLGFGPVIGALLKIQNAAGDRFSLSLQANDPGADPVATAPTPGPRAFAAICSPLQSAILPEVMAEVLPAKLATIIDLRRANLQDVFARAADAAIDPRGGDREGGGAVTAAVEGLARLVMAKTAAAGTVDDSVFRLSTDLVWARAAAAMLARCYAALPGTGLVWTVVQISSLPVRAEMSEALGHLYRAAVSVPGGRGRLVVAGSDPGIYDTLADLVRGIGDVPPGRIEFPPLVAGDITAWLDRWSTVVAAAQPERAARAATLRVQAAGLVESAQLKREVWELRGRVAPAVEVHDSIVARLSAELDLQFLKLDNG